MKPDMCSYVRKLNRYAQDLKNMKPDICSYVRKLNSLRSAKIAFQKPNPAQKAEIFCTSFAKIWVLITQ